MKLQPDHVFTEPILGHLRPFDRVFAFFYLSCAAQRATLIAEADDPIWLHRQVGDDKTGTRK